MTTTISPPSWQRLRLFFLLACLLGAALVFPRPDAITTGFIQAFETILSLLLAMIFAALCGSAGFKLLGLLNLDKLEPPAVVLLSFITGLGALCLSLLMLVFAGVYKTGFIITALLAWALWSGDVITPAFSTLGQAWNACRPASLPGRFFNVLLLLLLITLVLMSLTSALTPAWSYDALKEHLPLPTRLLEDGGFMPYPEEWAINSPAYINLVFGIGLGVGDSIFPRLIHLFLGILLVFGTGVLSRQLFGEDSFLPAIITIATVPTLPTFLSFAYIDAGWALFELGSIVSYFLWDETGDERILVLMSSFLGCAAGTKYTGLGLALLLGAAVLISHPRSNLRGVVRTVLLTVLPAFVIASPWYLKNWVLLGNPVFPWYFGGLGWDQERTALLASYAGSFGLGTSLTDFALVPLRLYTQPAAFGTVLKSVDTPGYLMPLALLFPIFRRDRRAVQVILLILSRTALWAFATQQTRFLLPIYPMIAASAGHVLQQGMHRFQKLWMRSLPQALMLGAMAVVTVLNAAVLWIIRPAGVLLGTETDAAFLSRTIKPYPAYLSVRDRFSAEDPVVMLGDARGYYCHPACLPDSDQYQRARELAALQTPEEIPLWLQDAGGQSLLISNEDLPFLIEHDRTGVYPPALEIIDLALESGILEVTYQDTWVTIMGIHADSSPTGKD